jgi:molybdenum cofactor biosynthesis enzyme MoaA
MILAGLQRRTLTPDRHHAVPHRRSCGWPMRPDCRHHRAVSHAFCPACDRTRPTADGQVRSCLFSREETDLRGLMRAGADDAAVEAAWRAAMWAKPAGHGINDPDFVQPDRPMSAIGG